MNEKDIKDYDWDKEVNVTQIDTRSNRVILSNGYSFDHKTWYEQFVNFWDKRIVGKTIVPTFYEHLFARGGSHQYSQLVSGKKHEGVLEGQIGKPMVSKKGLVIGSGIIMLIFVIMIVLIALKNEGFFPFLGVIGI